MKRELLKLQEDELIKRLMDKRRGYDRAGHIEGWLLDPQERRAAERLARRGTIEKGHSDTPGHASVIYYLDKDIEE